ncbi:MAG: hypothetical protein LBS60_04150 [Deltaproteobacteria bacterium]|nr:hypothetical protein [Deltaproteobacteria bacterium]
MERLLTGKKEDVGPLRRWREWLSALLRPLAGTGLIGLTWFSHGCSPTCLTSQLKDHPRLRLSYLVTLSGILPGPVLYIFPYFLIIIFRKAIAHFVGSNGVEPEYVPYIIAKGKFLTLPKGLGHGKK